MPISVTQRVPDRPYRYVPADTLVVSHVEDAPITTTLDVFEEEVGGRAALAASLAADPTLNPLEQRLLHLLTTGSLRRTPLVTLCADAGVTIGQLFAAYKRGALAKAHVAAVRRMVDAVPAIVEDLLAHCTTMETACTVCDGSGEAAEGKDCAACKGTGKVFVPSSLDHQKVVLGLLGYLQKNGGTNIQVTANASASAKADATGAATGGSFLDRLQRTLSEVPPARLARLTQAAAAVPDPDLPERSPDGDDPSDQLDASHDLDHTAPAETYAATRASGDAAATPLADDPPVAGSPT